MKKSSIINHKSSIIIALCALMLVACHKKPAAPENEQQQEQAAPVQEADPNMYIDITGMTSDGQELSLSELVGQSDYVLLDFWATWCNPCRQLMPVLYDLYYRFGGDRFEILSCSVDRDEAAWRDFLFETRYPWQQIREDDAHPCADKYGVQYIPYTVLIDKTGHIVAINPEEPELEEILLGE